MELINFLNGLGVVPNTIAYFGVQCSLVCASVVIGFLFCAFIGYSLYVLDGALEEFSAMICNLFHWSLSFNNKEDKS